MSSATKIDLSSKRRRFQPPITTFFTPSSDSNASSSPSHLSYNHYTAATNSPHPVLPGRIQASLLSVGMRVRKSVADGYKTHHAKPDPTTFYSAAVTKSTAKPYTQTYPSFSTRSELAPFCGMGKANDYTTSIPHPPAYTTTNIHSHHNHHHETIIDDNNDTFSLPPSSQETIDSEFYPLPTITPQRKRPHQDLTLDPYEVSILGDSDSENNYNFAPSNAYRPQTGRTILSPTLNHQRRRVFAAQRQKAGMGMSSMDLDDFEEPAFLRRREEVDMDGEVQMGGN
ncbi:ribonucleotide reductase inhibitor-domain-containing protein [Aspergillus spectabilis]